MEDNDRLSKYTTVLIPTPLAEKIANKIKGSGFPTVDAFVVSKLREVIGADEKAGADLTPEQEEAAKARLKAMGYLD